MAVTTLQVTLGAGNTQFTTVKQKFNWLIMQNNAAGNMRVGDVNISSSRGILLLPQGSATPPYFIQGQGDLSQWFAQGTAAQVLDVMYDSVAS